MTTKLEQVARQALEALEMAVSETLDYIQKNHLCGAENNHWIVQSKKAITALREALDPELQFVRDWNEGKVRRVSDGKVMGVAEQAEQEPIMRKTTRDEKIVRPGVYEVPVEQPPQNPVGVYFGEVEGIGHRVRLDVELPIGSKLYAAPVRIKDYNPDVIFNDDGTFSLTLPDGDELRIIPPQQEPTAEVTEDGYAWGKDGILPAGSLLYAAPVRTKDLTDDEIESVVANLGFAQLSPIEVARAVIAADREKNK